MIIKSYEIQRNPSNFLKYNLFLLYGENNGLKKDITESIKRVVSYKNVHIEILSFYENEITDNEENFYNSIYSGSLFGNKRVITIGNATDKIIKQIKDITDKSPDNITLIIFADLLELNRDIFLEGNSLLVTLSKNLTNDENRFKRINVNKVSLIKDLFNKPITNLELSFNNIDKMSSINYLKLMAKLI